MIVNGFILRENPHGINYIEIINPDWYNENTLNNYWYNLINSLKDIIENYELIADYIYYANNDSISDEDKNAFFIKINNIEETPNSIFINTNYGKIKIMIFSEFYYGEGRIETDGNNELLGKIFSLLENSSYFTKLDQKDLL